MAILQQTLTATTAILAVAAIGMGVYALNLSSSNKTLTEENASLTARLAESVVAVSRLQASINTQNDAISTLQQQTEERAKVMEQTLAHVRLQTTRLTERAHAVLTKPTTAATTCDRADELINWEIQHAN